MTTDNAHEVLPTRGAHLSLSVQGLYWSLVKQMRLTFCLQPLRRLVVHGPKPPPYITNHIVRLSGVTLSPQINRHLSGRAFREQRPDPSLSRVNSLLYSHICAQPLSFLTEQHNMCAFILKAFLKNGQIYRIIHLKNCKRLGFVRSTSIHK